MERCKIITSTVVAVMLGRRSADHRRLSWEGRFLHRHSMLMISMDFDAYNQDSTDTCLSIAMSSYMVALWTIHKS